MKVIIVTFILLTATIGYSQGPTPVKLKGQVVCSICWFEADDRKKVPYGTLADIKCATDCSNDNETQSLSVEDEKGFTLYTLEKGDFKTDGKDFLKLVPKMVEIEGTLRTEKDKKFLRVNSLTVIKGLVAKPTPLPIEAPRINISCR